MSTEISRSARPEELKDLDAHAEHAELSNAESQSVKGGLNPQPLPPRWFIQNPGYPVYQPGALLPAISQY